MWETKPPKPVKLIIGILAANQDYLEKTIATIEEHLGSIDLKSDIWPFTQTDYYKNQIGDNILRQFLTIENLIEPGKLPEIKLKTNKLEKRLAAEFKFDLPRPVNLDPGIIEPSKLILATTKNYSHRIYIGQKIFAEVTLIFDKGAWSALPYTYPDYKQSCYHEFFSKVRQRLLEQLKSKN